MELTVSELCGPEVKIQLLGLWLGIAVFLLGFQEVMSVLSIL